MPVKDKNGNVIDAGDEVLFVSSGVVNLIGKVINCHSDLYGDFVSIKRWDGKTIVRAGTQIELVKKAFNEPLTWNAKTAAPTITQRQEKPCQVCLKMNDLGVKSCWWCNQIPF